MPEYQLELKQVVGYPRCRVYRQFIQALIEDRSIRVSGGSGLFFYAVLCSYANFRTSYKRIGGISYTVYPGEWVCQLSEVAAWFRVRFQHQALAILDRLEEQHYITYSRLGRGRVVKFKITGWARHNKVLDYNAPCQKDTGFFFIPVSAAAELVSLGKCSEMDILLDLWINTVYNDEQVQGSDVGPVVYFRNGTGCPLVGYAELAERWGLSKATVGRVLKKLADLDYLSLLTFPGRHGSAIYLRSYLSTMFQVSDILVDKAEVAMALKIQITLPEEDDEVTAPTIPEERLRVSNKIPFVSNAHIQIILGKVVELLVAQGFSCSECPGIEYRLLPLSGNCGSVMIPSAASCRQFILSLACGGGNELLRFEMSLAPVENQNYWRNLK